MKNILPGIDFNGQNLDMDIAHVMGIVNVTPDSFSDGGELFQKYSSKVDIGKALERVADMVSYGAAIIDIGGESTRPGAVKITLQEEMDRVLPLVEKINSEFDVIISVDTSNPDIMLESAKAGAGLINDVRALQQEGALDAAATTGLPVCLMHMQGQPETMQVSPEYADVVKELNDFFLERVEACVQAGIDKQKLILDPGFGFGKTLEHNVTLLSRLDELLSLELPLLVGVSRKRMIGTITGKAEKERLVGSVAASVIAVMNGARIVRTHDVGATVDAIKVCNAILDSEGK